MSDESESVVKCQYLSLYTLNSLSNQAAHSAATRVSKPARINIIPVKYTSVYLEITIYIICYVV